jgi:hypothetical protein
MKIIRLSFTFNDKDYFCDRSYKEEETMQQNCDNALRFVSELVEQKKTLAAMIRLDEKEMKPVFINLAMIPVIQITDVSVYNVDEKQ